MRDQTDEEKRMADDFFKSQFPPPKMNTSNSEIKTPRTEQLKWGFANKELTCREQELFEHYAKLEQELQQALQWKEEDPRMLREQIRVADEAYNQLKSELQQAREELAVAQKHCWNNMVCIHHTDHERAAAIDHCPVCVENQLSQWQECARELYNTSEHENNLYLQLTSSIKQ